jgi:hypothetical protein
MPFRESLVRFEVPPSHFLQNESTGRAESGRGIGVNDRQEKHPSSSAGRYLHSRSASRANPSLYIRDGLDWHTGSNRD